MGCKEELRLHFEPFKSDLARDLVVFFRLIDLILSHLDVIDRNLLYRKLVDGSVQELTRLFRMAIGDGDGCNDPGVGHVPVIGIADGFVSGRTLLLRQ